MEIRDNVGGGGRGGQLKLRIHPENSFKSVNLSSTHWSYSEKKQDLKEV